MGKAWCVVLLVVLGVLSCEGIQRNIPASQALEQERDAQLQQQQQQQAQPPQQQQQQQQQAAPQQPTQQTNLPLLTEEKVAKELGSPLDPKSKFITAAKAIRDEALVAQGNLDPLVSNLVSAANQLVTMVENQGHRGNDRAFNPAPPGAEVCFAQGGFCAASCPQGAGTPGQCPQGQVCCPQGATAAQIMQTQSQAPTAQASQQQATGQQQAQASQQQATSQQQSTGQQTQQAPVSGSPSAARCTAEFRARIGDIARGELRGKKFGYCEKNRADWGRIGEYWKAGGGGTWNNPEKQPWCVGFVSWVYLQFSKQTGAKTFKALGVGGLKSLAPKHADYLSFIPKSDPNFKPQKGDVACSKGHCAIVAETPRSYPVAKISTIDGNYADCTAAGSHKWDSLIYLVRYKVC